MYIADTNLDVILALNISSDQLSLYAGGGTGQGLGYNGPATDARLDHPEGLAVDGMGNLFIADSYDNEVREVNAQTQMITMVAQEPGPTALAIVNGQLYVDAGAANDNGFQVVDVNLGTGSSTPIAGGGSSFATTYAGLATQANLPGADGVWANTTDLYISDNVLDVIFDVKLAGDQIAPYAGNGVGGSTDSGGNPAKAEFNLPGGLGGDASGDLFIADTGNFLIREVTAAAAMPVQISVSPATLNFVANSFTINYGSPLPDLTYTVNGLVNGDQLPVSGEPDLAIKGPDVNTNEVRFTAGTYPITITQGSLAGIQPSNYQLNFMGGVLTVLPPLPSLTAPVSLELKVRLSGASTREINPAHQSINVELVLSIKNVGPGSLPAGRAQIALAAGIGGRGYDGFVDGVQLVANLPGLTYSFNDTGEGPFLACTLPALAAEHSATVKVIVHLGVNEATYFAKFNGSVSDLGDPSEEPRVSEAKNSQLEATVHFRLRKQASQNSDSKFAHTSVRRYPDILWLEHSAALADASKHPRPPVSYLNDRGRAAVQDSGRLPFACRRCRTQRSNGGAAVSGPNAERRPIHRRGCIDPPTDPPEPVSSRHTTA